MRLRKIELANFKRLADFRTQFSPGINVVKGRLNEMGKSTLLEGIIVALFGNPRSTAREVKGYVSWGSTSQFRTGLEFEERGNRYLLEKDFGKGTARLTGDNDHTELDTFREISERMAELLGTKSEDLFLCSCCIRQAQVSEIASGKKEISESLEEIVTGGKESTLASQVIQKLDSRVAEMKRGLDKPAKNPGVLAGLRNQLRVASQRYADVRDEVSSVEAHRIKLMEVNKELLQVKGEHENARSLLEKNRLRKELEASIKDLEQKFDEAEKLLNGIRSLEEDVRKADRELVAIEGLKEKRQVSEFRKGLDAIRNRRGDIQEDLAEREKELVQARGKLEGRKLIRFLGSGKSITAAAAVLGGGMIGILVGPLYLLSLIVLGACLLGIAAWARVALIRDRTNISGIEERVGRMKESVEALGKEEEELLTQAKCSTIDEFDEKERAFYHWLEMKGGAELRLEGMVGGKTIQGIDNQRSEAARKLAVEQAKLTQDLIETCLGPEEYVALERKEQLQQAKRADLEEQKRRCEVIIEQARFNMEHQVELEEELEGLQQDLEQKERKVRIYQLAGEFISRARSEILASSQEALEQEIQRYLSVFTNGKYERVKIGREDLDFWVYSDEKEDWAKPEELSGGAIDQFYLAFRFALVKLIFDDKKPPLILDDPFVNFDSVRLASTLSFCRTLSSDYQIIIFTLSDSYDEVADNIILLGEEEESP